MSAIRLSCAAALVAITACSGGGGGGGGGGVSPGDGGALAASGKLDVSYGTSGKVTFAPAITQNVVVDGEGNAFVGVETADQSQAYVVKLDASGNVATAYGDAGRVVVSPNGVWAGAMTIDAAGNLYAATHDPGVGVVQFDALGHRVPSVGGLSASALPAAMVRLCDGTFYVAVVGSGFTGQTFSVLFKYDRNGRPDTSQAGASIGGATALVVDEARGAVYAAYRATLNRFDIATRTVGGLGTGFISVCGAAPVGMDVDSAGNVYFATTCGDGGVLRATIWKFDPLGHLVGTFGSNGFRTGIFGPDSAATMAPRVEFVRVGPDGSVYVGGASDQDGCYKLTIAKMDSQGRDVTSFGVGGRLVLDAPGSTATKIELDGHGRLYALGYSNGTCTITSITPRSFLLVRASA